MISVDTGLLEKIARPLEHLLSTYRLAIISFLSFALITVFIIMILNIVKLAKAGDNSTARKEASIGILVTGICTGLLGSIGIVYIIIISLIV